MTEPLTDEEKALSGPYNNLPRDLIDRFSSIPNLIKIDPHSTTAALPVLKVNGTVFTSFTWARNEDRVQLMSWWNPQTLESVGIAHLGPRAQGPPGHAHGGSIATILDDFLGLTGNMLTSTTERSKDHIWVVARLETKFLKPLPLNTLYFLEAKAAFEDQKRIAVHGTIFQLPPAMLPFSSDYHSHKVIYAEGKVSMSRIPVAKLKSAWTDSAPTTSKL